MENNNNLYRIQDTDKVRLKKGIASIILGLIAFCHGIAQDPSLKFHKVEAEGGRSLGKITAISQDPYGYMWFAGQSEKCIYRYDGVRVITFKNNPSDPNSLTNAYPECLVADDQGLIWIGFVGDDVGDTLKPRGLDQFNPTTGMFTHYRQGELDPASLSGNFVSALLNDSRGRLWVGTDNGLDLLDKKTGKFTHFRNEPGNPNSLSSNVVRVIYEDRNGVIWVGTGWPFGNIDPEDGGLNRLEPDGTFTRYLHDPSNSNTLINNKVRAIFEDSRGNFWIGTSGDGLHTMDRETGRIERHLYDPAKPEKLSRPPGRTNDDFARINDQVTFIQEDASKNLWISTIFSGISLYNPLTQKITHLGSNNGFPDDNGWCIGESRDGVLWIGTQEGNLFRIGQDKLLFENNETNNYMAFRFLEEKNGDLWIASRNGGLLQHDNNKKYLGNFDGPSQDTPYFFGKFVETLFQDQDDSLWLGTQGGVWIFDKRNNQFSKFPLGFDHAENHTSDIKKDHLGLIWISSWAGLVCFNKETGTIRHYLHHSTDSTSIGSNRIIAILEDQSGDLWIGTAGGGLNRFDRATNTFRSYLKSVAKITYLYEDSQGILWVGTDIGLYRSDEQKKQFYPVFDESDEMLNNPIHGIIEDEGSNLWITTDKNVIRFNPTRDIKTALGIESGIIPNTVIIPGAIHKTAKGEILIGHKTGFYSFFPDTFESNGEPLQILITNLLVNDLPVVMGQESVLSQQVDKMNEITLAYDQNNLSFLFAAIDYRSPETIRYATMLENYDEVWRAKKGEKTAHYFHLDPGRYTFRVKAENKDGVRVEKAILIKVNPPWWLTWWAYTIYGILGVIILVFARKQVINRERLHNRMEFEHLELEKAREIDQMKSRFFTNISHEFRTPLTLLLGPVNEMLSQASETGEKNRLKMMQRNTRQLLNLVNQLLDLSKLEAGKLKLEVVKTDVVAFVRSQGSTFKSLADHKHIDYRMKLPQEKIGLYFDQEKLEIIIKNILSNSLKFTPKHGRVELTLKKLIENHKEWVEIGVVDSGCGIPGDLIDKIFDRFYQVDGSHTREQEGTGIGLALTKELVELHHGKIQVNSELGKGTAFAILLPLGKGHLTEEEIIQELPLPAFEKENELNIHPAELAHPNEGFEEKFHSKEKPETDGVLPIVLMVEDNSDMRSYIKDTLGHTYSVLEAEDGKTGLEKARESIPDLILSDMMMPKMDGIELCKRLKCDERTSHIPVIMLTAKGSGKNKIEGLETGADDYIVKPFEAKELLVRIRNLIQLRKVLHEKFRKEIILKPKDIAVTSTDERFLNKVMSAIEENIDNEKYSVEQLGYNVGMSRSQLLRKLQALTGQSASQFIRNFRLERALELLKKDAGTVSEIAYQVGFGSPAYFVKCFREQYGYPPGEFKRLTEKS